MSSHLLRGVQRTGGGEGLGNCDGGGGRRKKKPLGRSPADPIFPVFLHPVLRFCSAFYCEAGKCAAKNWAFFFPLWTIDLFSVAFALPTSWCWFLLIWSEKFLFFVLRIIYVSGGFYFPLFISSEAFRKSKQMLRYMLLYELCSTFARLSCNRFRWELESFYFFFPRFLHFFLAPDVFVGNVVWIFRR